MSYSAKDKHFAGDIKRRLEDYGFEVFLAHEDIEPGVEWERRILRELNSCDILLGILTKNFKDSEWTDQEIGVALGLDKLIIPLKVDINPYGFIKRYQALRSDEEHIDKTCLGIIGGIRNEKRYESSLIDTLIRGFVNSDRFKDANIKAGLLEGFRELRKEQVTEILRGGIENPQVYEAYEAQIFLRKLIKKYSHGVDKNVIKRLTKILNKLRKKK